MLAGSTEPFGWAICEGGSVKLAEAMAAHLRDHGGEIRPDSTVRQIEARTDGRRPSFSMTQRDPVDGLLVSNLDPRHTFLELVGEQDLRPRSPASAVALRRHEHVLPLPRSRRAGALEGATDDHRRRALLRRVDVRVARRPRRQRVRLPARGAAAPAGPLLRAYLALRAEPLPPGKEARFVEQIAPYDLPDGGHEAWASSRTPTPTSYSTAGVPTSTRGPSPSTRRPLRLEPDRHRAGHALDEARRLEPRRDDAGPARDLRPFHGTGPTAPRSERLPLRLLDPSRGRSAAPCGTTPPAAIVEDLGVAAWWRAGPAGRHPPVGAGSHPAWHPEGPRRFRVIP